MFHILVGYQLARNYRTDKKEKEKKMKTQRRSGIRKTSREVKRGWVNQAFAIYFYVCFSSLTINSKHPAGGPSS